MTKFRLTLLAAAVAVPATAQAQSHVLDTTAYTQNFDTLAATGSTGTTLPSGFAIAETGSNANGSYGVGTGSSNTGNTYSFGLAGSTDRTLGSLGSGGITKAQYGAIFSNGLGATINALTFGYTGEQWRLGNSTDDGLSFEYSLDATSLTSGTWTLVDALGFAPVRTTGPEGALNGNLAANQRAIGATIGGLSIAQGSSFGFRWTDLNSGGNDHGLGVDDLSITSSLAAVGGVPEPATWGMMILGFGIVGGALRRRPARRAAHA